MKCSLLLVCLFLGIALSLDIPLGWESIERAHETQNLRVTFAIKHRDSDALLQLFDDIALPEGSRYRELLHILNTNHI